MLCAVHGGVAACYVQSMVVWQHVMCSPCWCGSMLCAVHCGVAACYVQSTVVCAVIFINVTLTRTKRKLPVDGRRPKHAGTVLI
jgi:hypothetical protein